MYVSYYLCLCIAWLVSIACHSHSIRILLNELNELKYLLAKVIKDKESQKHDSNCFITLHQKGKTRITQPRLISVEVWCLIFF